MYLNLDKMTLPQRLRVAEWLWENGVDGAISRGPVVVRGAVASYTELVLDARGKPVRPFVYRPRSIRVRTPLRLSDVPAA